jgi:quinol monooxygenase YgiN
MKPAPPAAPPAAGRPRSLRLLLVSLLPALSACTVTAPYRRVSTARPAESDPARPVIVALTAVEHRPGQRSAFFSDTRRVLDGMRDHPGLLGYAFRFEVFGPRAWTMSAWENQEALDRFVRSPAHRAAMRASAATSQNIRTLSLEVPAHAAPLRWKHALQLLNDTPLRSPAAARP